MVAALSAVVGLLSGIVGLYLQAAPIVSSAILRDFAPVGTVIASVLKPSDFAKLVGENAADLAVNRKWVLADGSDIKGTAFAKLSGTITVPDLRGRFLRGTAETGQAGVFQEFATALPRTSPFTGATSRAGQDDLTLSFLTPRSEGDMFEAGGNDGFFPGQQSVTIVTLHEHTVAIDGGGDPETRPDNVSVFYYIKVN